MSLIKSGEVVDLIDYDADVLVRMCTEWVNEIKQLFSQKKIIIVKTKNAKTFTDEGVLFSQNSYDSSLYKHDDKLFEIAYNCVEKQLPNAYVIEALPTLVGNVQHKWGRFGLHYVDEVYMYLFSCFDYIMNTNASRENKYAYMLKQNRIYAERIFEKYVNISNNSIQTARNILDTVKGIKIGRYEKNGIVVNVEEGLCFSVEGTAKEDTVFYLYTKGGNPCGEWRSHEQHIPGGDYLFTTDFACQSDAYFVQLVLTDNDNNRRWIYGHLAGEFTLDHDYTYCLIRLVIRKGVSINSTGRLFLESTKKSKTGNTV